MSLLCWPNWEACFRQALQCLCCLLGLSLVPVAAQIPCSNIIAAKSVQLPSTFSLLLLTQLFRKGESLSNQPYGMQFYLPW